MGRASALHSVDLGFIPLVESYQKTLKNDIHSFPAWRSAFREGCKEQADKFACCVLGQRPRLYVESRWPTHLEYGNSQASADVPSKNIAIQSAFSWMEDKYGQYKTKK